MGKHLFDEIRLNDAVGNQREMYGKMAILLDQEIERNVREALGKVEMGAHPEIMPFRVLSSGEDELLSWGWKAAMDFLRRRTDDILKEYHI